MSIKDEDIPTTEETLNYAIENLHEAMHKFCCFVDGFERYLISNTGLIKSICKNGKETILKQHIKNNGYLSI